jgi:hypothetical protein
MLFDRHMYQTAFAITAVIPVAGMILWNSLIDKDRAKVQ